MRFTSCIPALDMLTVPLDPLSKPVGPIIFNELFHVKVDGKDTLKTLSLPLHLPR